MSVRNYKDIGLNAQAIIKRLLNNQDLLKLLYKEGKDPLSEPDIGAETIKSEIFEKLIKIIPHLWSKDDAKSVVSVLFSKSLPNQDNPEFKDVMIIIETFIPITQWFIKDTNLRPFAIMGEIQKSLDGKKINGLGKMSGGEFELNFVTDEMTSYRQFFRITSYD